MACAEASTAPFPEPEATYVAQRLGTDTLPVLTAAVAAYREYLDFSAVSFGRDGSAVRTLTYRQVVLPSGETRTQTKVFRRQVAVRGDSVTLRAPACPPSFLSSCAGPEFFVRQGADLVTSLTLASGPQSLRFVRR